MLQWASTTVAYKNTAFFFSELTLLGNHRKAEDKPAALH